MSTRDQRNEPDGGSIIYVTVVAAFLFGMIVGFQAFNTDVTRPTVEIEVAD